jgi:DNA-binding response OmpR family regulator
MAKILVVEKDKSQQKLLKNLFLDEGYEVKTTGNGAEALDILETQAIDLVLLDKSVTDIKSESICWQIRSNYPEVSIILIVSQDEFDEVRRLFRAGADDFIVKPLDTEELLTRIKASFTKPRASQTKLEVADLKIDLKKFTAVRNGKLLKLTPREFKLLKFLMRNKGRVLTREIILDRVWSYDESVNSRAIDVYVGYLRKKVDSGFKKKLIKTVRGFGYMIKD